MPFSINTSLVVPVPQKDNTSRGATIIQIEDIIASVIETIMAGQNPSITLRRRGADGEVQERVVTYPGSDVLEANKFSKLWFLESEKTFIIQTTN